MKTQKGQYGYIDAYKKRKLIGTLILSAMIAFVILSMLLMYGDTQRVMVVFAILLVLPFAKLLVAYIVCAKFSTMERDCYEKIVEVFCRQKGEDEEKIPEALLFDVVISEYEGMHFFPSLCVKNGNVCALVTDRKYRENKKDYERCIEQAISHSKYHFVVHIYDDVEAYAKKIASIPEPNHNNLLIDRHMREQILSYCV